MPDLDLETILLELPPRRIEPHPDLVASIRPTPRQMCEAAAVLGWLPGGPEPWRCVSKRCRFCLDLVTECVCDDDEGLVQDDGSDEDET